MKSPYIIPFSGVPAYVEMPDDSEDTWLFDGYLNTFAGTHVILENTVCERTGLRLDPADWARLFKADLNLIEVHAAERALKL